MADCAKELMTLRRAEIIWILAISAGTYSALLLSLFSLELSDSQIYAGVLVFWVLYALVLFAVKWFTARSETQLLKIGAFSVIVVGALHTLYLGYILISTPRITSSFVPSIISAALQTLALAVVGLMLVVGLAHLYFVKSNWRQFVFLFVVTLIAELILTRVLGGGADLDGWLLLILGIEGALLFFTYRSFEMILKGPLAALGLFLIVGAFLSIIGVLRAAVTGYEIFTVQNVHEAASYLVLALFYKWYSASPIFRSVRTD